MYEHAHVLQSYDGFPNVFQEKMTALTRTSQSHPTLIKHLNKTNKQKNYFVPPIFTPSNLGKMVLAVLTIPVSSLMFVQPA